MAYLIPPIGEMREVLPADLDIGFTLDELYDLIGCECIDIVGIFDGRKMVVDDNGKLKNLPPNLRATVLYQEGRVTGWAIVGNVVLGSDREIQ